MNQNSYLSKPGRLHEEASVEILLMVQKSGIHQLRLVVYPFIYYIVLYIPAGLQDFFISWCPKVGS